jgi:hypothetical protein
MGLIHTGILAGRWHAESVSFDIQQTFDNGAFNGVGTFTDGRFQGTQFGFEGSLAGDGSLQMTRDTGQGLQNAKAGPPQLIGGRFVWEGNTSGAGIPGGGLPFELQLPGLIDQGSFTGQWHAQPVSFDFQQTFTNRAFNGVGTFTGGPFQGTQFGFEGSLAGDGSLHMTRDTGEGLQNANAGPPQLIGGRFVWEGNTSGAGIPGGGLPFELRL